MATKRAKEERPRPAGALITLDAVERKRLRDRRISKGWDQKDVAKRIGVTAPTISNIETGRHPQIRKAVYADLLRVLFRSQDTETNAASDAAFRSIVEDLVDLDLDQQLAVQAIVKTVKKPR